MSRDQEPEERLVVSQVFVGDCSLITFDHQAIVAQMFIRTNCQKFLNWGLGPINPLHQFRVLVAQPTLWQRRNRWQLHAFRALEKNGANTKTKAAHFEPPAAASEFQALRDTAETLPSHPMSPPTHDSDTHCSQGGINLMKTLSRPVC